jgi:hypothetical protein
VNVRPARLWALLGSGTYTVVFHVVYVTVIAPNFAYDGSFYAPVSDLAVWVAGAAAVLPSLWLPSRVTRPSQVTLWVVYLVAYVPASLLIYYVLERDLADLWAFTLALLTAMAILGVMDRLPRTYWVVPFSITFASYTRLLAVAAFATVGYIAFTVGINFRLPNLLEVGDTRASFGAAVEASGTVLAYVVVWSVNVVGPLLVAIGLRQRRPTLVALGVGLELVIYGITGFKTALFSGVLVVGLVVMLSLRPRPAAAMLPWVASSLIVIVVLFDHVIGSIVTTSIFVRRILEVPALVTSRYFEFFSENPTYNLAHSFLRIWFQPPSELAPPALIGSAYFDSGTWANGGVWADGFANFGFAGILGFTVILGAVFWLLDVVAGRADLAVTGSVAGILGVILTNTGLFTTLVSHGLGLAIVAFAVLPRRAPGARAQREAGAAAGRELGPRVTPPTRKGIEPI